MALELIVRVGTVTTALSDPAGSDPMDVGNRANRGGLKSFSRVGDRFCAIPRSRHHGEPCQSSW
jgi:hypothetical protein